MNNKNNITGIILDYGGTLDSNGIHWAHIIWEAYKKENIPVSEEQFREAYVYGERFLAKHPVICPDFTFWNLMNVKIKTEIDFLLETGKLQQRPVLQEQVANMAVFCYEFAKQTVEESQKIIELLSRNYPLILVSNFYGNIQTVLQDFHINEFFSEIIESAVVNIRKPDPRIFMLGVKALNMDPEKVVVIGDSYKKDIIPAKQCGCHTIWIKGKGWEKEEEKNRTSADFVFSKFKEVTKVLCV